MHTRRVMPLAVLLAFGLFSSLAGAQSPRMILALGNTGFLNPGDIQVATGAEVKQDMERFEPKHFAVIVLANVAYAALPAAVQQGLEQYVNGGGTVLITGGAQSFGSGGYQVVASILPFQIRSTNDWRFTAFRSPVLIQPSHPILVGLSFSPIGTLNDLNPRGDAAEILQSAGGGVAGPRYPLIAEVASGAGRVLGVAFDLNEFGGMPDRGLFVRNAIAYLLGASRIQAR